MIKYDFIVLLLILDLKSYAYFIRFIETLKQEGESCGSSRSKICGNCAEGLDCNAPMDMCGQCVQK